MASSRNKPDLIYFHRKTKEGDEYIGRRRHKCRKYKEENNQSNKAVDIPWDIICNIVARVPFKSLMRFKAVSKRWENLTRDPYFLEMWSSNNPPSNCFILSRSSDLGGGLFLVDKQNHEWKMSKEIIPHPILQYNPDFQVVSACNGLLCLSDYRAKEIIIYNPLTREIRETPELWTNGCGWGGVYFVHDAIIKKYKLLVLASSKSKLVGYTMTLGEAYWKKLDIPQEYELYHCRAAVSSSGEICWIIRKLQGQLRILIMDISNEEFKVIKLHDEYNDFRINLHQNYSLFAYGQHVNLFATVPVPGEKYGMQVQVWTLMDSKQGIWISKKMQNKVFRDNVEVVNTVGGGSLLLKFGSDRCNFIIYDPESGNVSDILSPGDPKIYDLFSFAPSLVSVKF